MKSRPRKRGAAKPVVMGVFATLDRAHLRANPVQGPELPPHRATLAARLREALGEAPPELVALCIKALS